MRPITKKYLAYKHALPEPFGRPLFWYRKAMDMLVIERQMRTFKRRVYAFQKAMKATLSNCIYGLPTTCMKGDTTNVGKSEERPGNNG